jgi:hypothetical protein
MYFIVILRCCVDAVAAAGDSSGQLGQKVPSVADTFFSPLYVGSPNRPALASFDTDLQQMIAAWDGLPEAIRRALLGLLEPQSISG